MPVVRPSRSILSDHSENRAGYFWVRWETWGYFTIVLTTEVVLLLWIFVVYDRNLWILAFMGFLMLGEIATVATILAMSFSNFHGAFWSDALFQKLTQPLAAEAHLLPGITFCLVVHEPAFYHRVWLPILVYHTILFTLFLTKGYMVYRQRGYRTWKSTGLLETIYKNSLINFLSIFAAYLSCAVMWMVADPFLAQIPVGFAVSLSITSCTRLLLNIRDAYYAQAENDPYRISLRRPVTRSIVTGTSSSFWAENESKPVRIPSIYAEYTTRDQWVFELREMKWSGH